MSALRQSSSKKMPPIPMMVGRSLPDHLKLNTPFIRQCHEGNMRVVEIGSALGLKCSKTVLYAAFSDYRVGRSHMGFDPIIEVQRREREAAFTVFKERVIPQKDATGLRHVKNNSDLIIEMHHAGFYQDDIADVLAVSVHNLNGWQMAAGVNRKALNLPKLKARQKKQSYRATKPRQWLGREDAHIRRGHACGFMVAAVGALCRRSGRDIQMRAAELGLGPWRFEYDPRRRQVLAQDYDAKHDVEILQDDATSNRDRDHKGLSKDASYLK